MSTTRIIHTVTARDMSSLLDGRDKATGADLVELRLDGVRDLNVAGALHGRMQPVIVTCRPVWEGGAFDGAEETRQRVIQEAVALGAEYVDVERRALWRPDRTGSPTRLVLSDHEFSHVPADLSDRVAAMRREHPDIVKVAAMAQSASDCLAMREAVGGEPASVVIAMGPYGRITRVLPSRFGSCWTYGGTAAPGQPAVDELVHRFRARDVTEATEVYAVTGRPLDHSASPAMHNAAFVATGRDAVYVPLEATSLADALTVADALGMQGLSVTAPFKHDWPGEVDDDAAWQLGAINTLKRVEGRWVGRNVDGDGFLTAFDSRGLNLSARRVVILGAGGAARAVGHAMASRGAHVSFSARNPDAAEAAAALIGADVVPWPPEGPWDLIVNATPVGTWPHIHDLPLTFDDIFVLLAYDLVYNPEETAWLQAAWATGAQGIGGLEMLVGQAVRQSFWWTGQAPRAEVLTTAARAWIQTKTDENR